MALLYRTLLIDLASSVIIMLDSLAFCTEGRNCTLRLEWWRDDREEEVLQ